MCESTLGAYVLQNAYFLHVLTITWSDALSEIYLDLISTCYAVIFNIYS